MASGRLGCLESLECYITDQCGAPRICGLTNISSVQFNRILDEVSEAVVVIPVAAGVSTTKPCCDCLDQVEPWCHELHIIRNGEEVWTGPIVKVTYQYTQVIIEARDVIAWTAVRIPVGFLDNTTSTTSVAAASAGVDISTFTDAAPGTLFVNDASQFSPLGGTLTIGGSTTVTTGFYPQSYNGAAGEPNTINVTSTAGFAASGTITVGSRTFSYTGITATSFTGAIRTSAQVLDDFVAVGTQVKSSPTITLTYKGISGNSFTGVSSGGVAGTLVGGTLVSGPSNGDEITDLAVDVLETAFSEHDPCVLDYIVQLDLDSRPTLFSDTVISPENGFAAFEGTVFDWLETLADNGLDYTAFGRSIILSVEDTENVLPLGTLTDEHILGEVELSKDGFRMVNRAYVRFAQDTDGEICALQNPTSPVAPCPALSESEDLRTDVNDTSSVCYGPVERIFDDASPFNYNTAKQTADAYIRDAATAPRVIEFPSGSRLSPDTPWGFNDMIPGQKVLVSLGSLCLDVFQPFRILEVSYNLQAEGDEEITLSLGPFNTIPA